MKTCEQLSQPPRSKFTAKRARLQRGPSGVLSVPRELWGPWVPGRLTRQPVTAAHVQGPSLGVIGRVLLSRTPAADEKCQMTPCSWDQGRTLNKDKKASCSNCVPLNNPTPWWGRGRGGGPTCRRVKLQRREQNSAGVFPVQ